MEPKALNIKAASSGAHKPVVGYLVVACQAEKERQNSLTVKNMVDIN